jgi:hypothetical protein
MYLILIANKINKQKKYMLLHDIAIVLYVQYTHKASLSAGLVQQFCPILVVLAKFL